MVQGTFFLITLLVTAKVGAYDRTPQLPLSGRREVARVVREGGSVTLKCQIRGTGMYYRWFRGGPRDQEIRDWSGEYRLSGLKGRRLTIARLGPATVGRYTCEGVNGFGHETYSYLLRLAGQGEGQRTVLLPGVLRDLEVREGEPITLSCTLREGQEGEVRWLRSVQHGLGGEGARVSLLGGQFQVFQPSNSSRFQLSSYKVERQGGRGRAGKGGEGGRGRMAETGEGGKVFTLKTTSARVEDGGQYLCLLFPPGSSSLDQWTERQVAQVKVIYTPATPNLTLKGEEKRPVSTLTVVLAVLGSVVLLLLMVLVSLLCTSSRGQGKGSSRKEVKEKEQDRGRTLCVSLI